MTLTAEAQPVRDVTVVSAIGGKKYGVYLPSLAKQQASMDPQEQGCVAESIVVCEKAIEGEVWKTLEPMWKDHPELGDRTRIVPIKEWTTAAACWNMGKEETQTQYLATIGADDMYPQPTASQPKGGLDLLRAKLIETGTDLVVARPKFRLLHKNGEVEFLNPTNKQFGPLAGKIITAKDVLKMKEDLFPWWLGAMLGEKDKLFWDDKDIIGEDLRAAYSLMVEHGGSMYVSGPNDPHSYDYTTNNESITHLYLPEKRKEIRDGITIVWVERAQARVKMARAVGTDATGLCKPLTSSSLSPKDVAQQGQNVRKGPPPSPPFIASGNSGISQ